MVVSPEEIGLVIATSMTPAAEGDGARQRGNVINYARRYLMSDKSELADNVEGNGE